MEGATAPAPVPSEGFLRAFRDAAGEFATGVAVLTVETADGASAGMTLNSFTSVSLDPVLVLVSLGHGSRTLEAARAARSFTISILHRGQSDVALAFAEPGAPFPGRYVEHVPGGGTAIRGASASLHCSLHGIVPAGDHDVLLGKVISLEHGGGRPLLFHRGRFGGFGADAYVPTGHPIAIEEGAGW